MSLISVAGIDEVGRGSLAGPILAVAAVFFLEQKNGFIDYHCPPYIAGLKDSKKFSSQEARTRIFRDIIKSPYLADFGVGIAAVSEIDALGIDHCNNLVFTRAIENLQQEPFALIIDGTNGLKNFPQNRQVVVPKADSLYWQVSAASILAKVIRDNIMADLHQDYPQYNWADNAGYGANKHITALEKTGPTPHHRQQFIRKILCQSI